MIHHKHEHDISTLLSTYEEIKKRKFFSGTFLCTSLNSGD